MRKESIKNWLLRTIVLVLIPMVLLSIAIQTYSVYLLDRNAQQQTERTLELFAQSVTEDLNRMYLTLQTAFTYNTAISQLIVSEDEVTIYFSGNDLQLDMSKEILTHDLFDGMFMAAERDDGLIFLPADSGKGTYCSKEVHEYLMAIDPQKDLGRWNVVQMRGEPYLICVVQNGSAYAGAWMRVNNIVDQFAADTQFEELVVYTDEDQLLAGTKGVTDRFWQDWVNSRNDMSMIFSLHGNHYITAVYLVAPGIFLRIYIPEADAMQNVRWMRHALLGFLLFSVISVPILLNRMHRRLIAPVQMMAKAMEEIQLREGGEQLTLPNTTFRELEILETNFNQMKEQIHQLRIETYEQKIREQEIHMQYLSSQIQPHFFLNSLNIIFSFAQIKRFDLIQQMTLTLVRYFRYVFQNASGSVLLKEELEHVDDYLEIQALRYPGTFIYHKSVDKELMNIRILPFLLQTFMENSVKYVLNEEEENEINLDIHRMDEKYIRVQIWDTGSGFPAEILTSQQLDTERDSRHQIGLRNASQRLMIYYRGKANIHLYNREEGGACVELILPIDEQKGAEK